MRIRAGDTIRVLNTDPGNRPTEVVLAAWRRLATVVALTGARMIIRTTDCPSPLLADPNDWERASVPHDTEVQTLARAIPIGATVRLKRSWATIYMVSEADREAIERMLTRQGVVEGYVSGCIYHLPLVRFGEVVEMWDEKVLEVALPSVRWFAELQQRPPTPAELQQHPPTPAAPAI